MPIHSILSILDEILSVLNEYQINDWSRIIEEHKLELSKAMISGNDPRIQIELRDILGLYGGMGSFNDIYITDKPGCELPPDLLHAVNHHLQQLQSDLFDSITTEISKHQGCGT
jgi:hypothetical protein